MIEAKGDRFRDVRLRREDRNLKAIGNRHFGNGFVRFQKRRIAVAVLLLWQLVS